jgi:D-arabinose 5-phosphate isomerase GutQ
LETYIRISVSERLEWEDESLTKLNHLEDKYWSELEKIVIFGFGRQGFAGAAISVGRE